MCRTIFAWAVQGGVGIFYSAHQAQRRRNKVATVPVCLQPILCLKIQKVALGVQMAEEELDERASFLDVCLLYTSPSPRDRQKSRMPSSA